MVSKRPEFKDNKLMFAFLLPGPGDAAGKTKPVARRVIVTCATTKQKCPAATAARHLLPDEDSNLDKQNQNLSYYLYTIGQDEPCFSKGEQNYALRPTSQNPFGAEER
jgi:hypothetical protein